MSLEMIFLELLAAIARPLFNEKLSKIINAYGPQLGEMVWHSFHDDQRMENMTRNHAEIMLGLIDQYELKPKDRQIRILEVGAYAHYSAQLAASKVLGISVATDISPISLRVGATQASQAGLKPGQLVASDFHDLPFTDNYFDLVFIASSVHHTFRPWIMMGELFRVTRPGGVVHLENEPVGRAFSFYQYRGNRPDTLTPFETAVSEAGLTWTLSSPFPGSRSEELFGMIENDRIPLSTYLDTFLRHGEIASLKLGSHVHVGEFEKLILKLPRDQHLAARIFDALDASLVKLLPKLTANDIFLGFSVPKREAVWKLAYASAELIRKLDESEPMAFDGQLAALFGAPLKASIIKKGSERIASSLFRRSVGLEDGVYVDRPQISNLSLDFSSVRLPDIQSGDEKEIEYAYPLSEWIRYKENNGLFSMLNRGQRATINISSWDKEFIALIRFFAAGRDMPYELRFTAGDEVLDTQLICQSESRLARFIVPRGTRTIVLELLDLEGGLLYLHGVIHIGIARLIPIQ